MCRILQALAHTPVVQQAEDIFSQIHLGGVLLLEGDTGSGKSLVSPMAAWNLLREPVLVLVPGVDVARDNARRIAELSGLGWSIGREVGLYAGRTHLSGSYVVVATYGSYMSNKALQKGSWKAILLDETHVETWEVEVARADAHARLRLGEQVAVMEMSATMNASKLCAYWEAGGIPVVHYQVASSQMPQYKRELVHAPYETLTAAVMSCLLAGDRFVMVTRPGLVEVGETASSVYQEVSRFGLAVQVFTYHAETDPKDVERFLAPLAADEIRVVVATPRLLTGFNHEDIDSVVTDGRAKYLHSDTRGGEVLREGDMSQYELRQALGRVGRFKDGVLVLASSDSFEDRPLVMEPEVRRLSSVPLALGLFCLERDPLSTAFCNQPKDLAGAVTRLQQWGFVSERGLATALGYQAEQLGLRPDLAKVVLDVVLDEYATLRAKAAAIVMVAAAEVGTVCGIDSNGMRMWSLSLNRQSDYANEALRFLRALQVVGDLRDAGYSGRAVSRVKSVVYRLLEELRIPALNAFFGNIFSEDKDVRQEAWRVLAKRLHDAFSEELPILRRALIRAMQDTVWVALFSRRQEGSMLGGDAQLSIGYESDVSLQEGDLFLATPKTIVPRNGHEAFDVLVGVTVVTLGELAAALPEVFVVRNERIEVAPWEFERRRTLFKNGVSVCERTERIPLTLVEVAARDVAMQNRDHLKKRLQTLNERRVSLDLPSFKFAAWEFRDGAGEKHPYTEEVVAEFERQTLELEEEKRAKEVEVKVVVFKSKNAPVSQRVDRIDLKALQEHFAARR